MSVLYAAVDSLKEKQSDWTDEEKDFQVGKVSFTVALACFCTNVHYAHLLVGKLSYPLTLESYHLTFKPRR